MNMIRYTTLILLFAASPIISQTWKAIPAPVAEISCIKGDPHRPGMVWLVGHGVIAGTSDGGARWVYKSFSEYANLVPRDLLIDIEDSTRWYMAEDGAGYMRSTDAGVSWEFMNDDLFVENWTHFKKISQDKSEPNIMYLVSSESVYKSTDRGESWKSILRKFRVISEAKDVASVLLINHRDHDSLYVFASQSPVKRWVSGDQGNTWEADSSSEMGTLDTYSISDDGELLVGAWRSIDYGENWTRYKKLLGINKKPPSFDASNADVSVYDAGAGRYLLGCGSGLYWRKESEEAWQPTALSIETEGFYGAVHSLYYDEYNATLWGVHLYRIFKSTDGGNTIEYMEAGPFLATTGYLTTYNAKGGIIMGSSVRTLDNGKHWECPVDPAMTEVFAITQVAISPIDSMFIVRGIVPMSYTTSGWSDEANWKISNTLYAALPLRHKIQFNPHNPHELFGGTERGLWRVTDSIIVQPLEKPVTITEHIITPKWPDGTPKKGYTSTAMTFHPHQDGVYFLCTTELLQFEESLATLWKTTDFGKTWLAILDRMSMYYYDICINPQNPDIILIGSANGVLRSGDGGKTWVQNHNPPFQAALIWSVIVDPRFPNVYYCGSESVTGYWTHWDTGLRSGGMYASYDYGETWEALPLDGMHNVSVRFIHYHENPRRLIVSTWAGIYEMLLPEYTTNTLPVPESAALDVRVYPNPATSGDTQTLRVYGAGGRHALVDLYSIQGRHVARVHEGVLEAGATLRQTTDGLSSGMYYYRVITGTGQRSVPVVIQR